MSMFKTVGAVVGGVVVGVTTTIVLKDRRTFVDEIEKRMANKVKEKAGEAIKDIGEKVVESVSDEDKATKSKETHLNNNNVSDKQDEIVEKIEQIEKLIGDVKDMLNKPNKCSEDDCK